MNNVIDFVYRQSLSKIGQYSYSNAIGEHRGSDAIGWNNRSDVSRNSFPNELYKRRMEKDKKKSTYCDRGVHVSVHSYAECDCHGFQLKELVQIDICIRSIYENIVLCGY